MNSSVVNNSWYVRPTALELIISGRQSMIGRIGYGFNRTVKKGEIHIRCRELDYWEWMARVTDVQEHKPGTTFGDAVTDDNYKQLVPLASSPKRAVGVLDGVCSAEEQRKYGVVLYGMEYFGAHID